jgi:hypothetical protein
MSESFPVKFVPTLAINRLLIYRKGQAVYDQKFHYGVNIIRGTNGSGKSTILDFIFHILGGEVLGPTVPEWKEYASLCDSVVAEVTINDAVVTLRREITPERTRPLHFFFDRFENAAKSVAEGWQIFPYSRQGSRESFSQIFFRALQMPEATTPEGNNITMHQVLRLLYADQMTPVQRIFRFENFDPPILKQAVGDFLCGVSEFSLYEKQVALRALEKQFDDVNSELKSIFALGEDLDTPLASNALTVEIEELTGERVERYLELEKTAQSDFGADDSSKQRENARRQAFNEVGSILAKIQSLEFENRTLEFEITDSEKFLQHLHHMLQEIDKASVTYEELGGIHFQYCPACFSPTVTDGHSKQCHLCKTPLDDSERASRSLAVKIDLQMQLRESQQLQDERQLALDANSKLLRAARREHSSKAAAYDALSRAPISSRDAAIARLNRRIGFIDSRIETLNQRQEMASKIREMAELKARLNGQITTLKEEIRAISSAQEKRRRRAYTTVANNVIGLLHQDTGDQDAFIDAKSFAFSFGNDSMSVDGKSNFAASSLVILKNSFHLGLLISSLQDKEFLLPRFMMFDNIEDKGMVPQRSWNFQKLICEASLASQADHQIILTTSMLDPALEGSKMLVGPSYSQQNRTGYQVDSLFRIRGHPPAPHPFSLATLSPR